MVAAFGWQQGTMKMATRSRGVQHAGVAADRLIGAANAGRDLMSVFTALLGRGKDRVLADAGRAGILMTGTCSLFYQGSHRLFGLTTDLVRFGATFGVLAVSLRAEGASPRKAALQIHTEARLPGPGPAVFTGGAWIEPREPALLVVLTATRRDDAQADQGGAHAPSSILHHAFDQIADATRKSSHLSLWTLRSSPTRSGSAATGAPAVAIALCGSNWRVDEERS